MKTRVCKLSNGKWAAQGKYFFMWRFLTATGNSYTYSRPNEYCWCDTREKAIQVAQKFYCPILWSEKLT